MERTTGKLIAIEGIDGAGKTTQAILLKAFLERLGFEVVLSKEPTNGKWGSRIRESATKGRLPLNEEIEAFIEDRREHVAQLIQPSLNRGCFVIVDRYFLSTVAYQGARGASEQVLLEMNEAFAPLPDLAVIIEVEVATALERIKFRGNGKNLFERARDLEKVKTGFERISRPYVVRIDGEAPVSDVFREVIGSLLAHSVIDAGSHSEAVVDAVIAASS